MDGPFAPFLFFPFSLLCAAPSRSAACRWSLCFACRSDILLYPTDHYGNVAGSLANPCRPPQGSRTEASQGWTLIHPRPEHDQFVRGKLPIVLGVGDGRLEDLGDRLRSRSGGKLQHAARIVNMAPPDQIHDLASLGRRDPHVPGCGARLLALAG